MTTGGVITSYSDPRINGPWGITAGPDGAVWFTNDGDNTIGRITTSGAVTSYSDPSISRPLGIAAGPDGAVWFTNGGNNSIGRIAVVDPAALFASLLDAVNGLLHNQGLVATLENAQSKYAANKIPAACDALGDFIAQVRAQSGKKIPASLAATLVSTARQLETALRC